MLLGIVGAPLVAPPAAAAWITPTKTIVLSSYITDIEIDPARPLAYLAAGDINSVLVFSFATLDLAGQIFVGSQPGRMDLDPVTDRLYVALSGGLGVAVVDLATQTLAATWSMGGGASDVAVGRPGRLYVTMQDTWTNPRIVETANGSVVAEITALFSVYSGAILEMSPDFRYLYLAERGLSPASLYKLDVQTDNAALVVEDQHGSLGSNLQDMVLSPDGTRMYMACGAPYYIQVLDTNTITAVGQLPTGAYPSTTAVNGDGSIVLGGKFDFYDFTFYSFDAATFSQIDSFSATDEVWDVAIDAQGRYILAFTADTYYGLYYLDVYADVYAGPPTGTILTPLPSSAVPSSDVALRVRFEDPDGVDPASLALEVDGSPLAVTWNPTTREVSGTATGLAPGVHDAEARGSDLLGYGPRILTWQFSVDVAAPTSSVDPLPAYSTGTPLIVTVTANDDQGVTYVELYMRTGGGPWQYIDNATWPPGAFAVWVSEGSHEFYSVAVDRAGNREAAPSSADASTFVDNDRPALVITAPTGGGWMGADVTVEWTVTDSGSGVDTLDIRIDSEPWTALAPTATSHTYPGVADGMHFVEVHAADRAGWDSWEYVDFQVDSTPPAIHLLSPVGIPRLASGPVVLRWIASDTTSGIAGYEVSTNNGSFVSLGMDTSVTFDTLAEGVYFFRIRASDLAGNVAEAAALVEIRPTPPPPAVGGNVTHTNVTYENVTYAAADIGWIYVLVAASLGTNCVLLALFAWDLRRRRKDGGGP